MRKLGLAAALAAAVLFAQGARANDTTDTAKEKADQAAGATRKTGERWKEGAQRAANGSGSSGSSQKAEESKSPMNGDVHNRTAQNAEKKHSMFDGKNNFDVDGKIAKVSGTSITISREDLPPAELKVSHETKIELDGDHASAQQLKEGQDVKASFNLNKDKAEAVEIKAKRTDAQKDAQKRHEEMNRNDMNGPNKK